MTAADFGLAQAHAETKAWASRQHRYGVSFKQGHRVGFADGAAWAGASWATITPGQRAEHLDVCRDTCVFCADHRAFGECKSCGGRTEALGADELSRCCGSSNDLAEHERAVYIADVRALIEESAAARDAWTAVPWSA